MKQINFQRIYDLIRRAHSKLDVSQVPVENTAMHLGYKAGVVQGILGNLMDTIDDELAEFAKNNQTEIRSQMTASESPAEQFNRELASSEGHVKRVIMNSPERQTKMVNQIANQFILAAKNLKGRKKTPFSNDDIEGIAKTAAQAFMQEYLGILPPDAVKWPGTHLTNFRGSKKK